MVQLLFSVLVFLPAFLVGLEVVPLYGLAITVAAIYAKSVLTVGESVPGGDFRRLNSNEFESKDKAIKVVAIGLSIMAFLIYGLGWLLAWFF